MAAARENVLGVLRRPRPGEETRRVRELGINTRARNALQHVTASPRRIGLIARAAPVLVLIEYKMIK
jgi:hypothetical protein